MKFAIVDDDASVFDIIEQSIKQIIPDKEISILSFQTGSTFLVAHENNSFDAIFLDIDMPEMSGFDLAIHLHDTHDNTPIVFITGCDHLITHAFRYKALGFVHKHHLNDELPYAVSTILLELQKKSSTIIITELRSDGGKKHCVEIEKINYIESHNHATFLHLSDGKIYSSRNSLSVYVMQKGFENFAFINSGTIVNLLHGELEKGKFCFQDGTSLFISRRKMQDVQDAYLRAARRILI